MFQPGDLVVYGTTGVCSVKEITRPNKTGPDREKQYYLLDPLYQDGIIYTPVQNGKVPMRAVISTQEAEALIDLIPSLEAEAYHSPTIQALAQHYQSVVRNNDCRDLIELMLSIYAKRALVESQNRRLGIVDERFMKQAERLLYGEFSAALGIPFDDVHPYISQRIGEAEPKS